MKKGELFHRFGMQDTAQVSIAIVINGCRLKGNNSIANKSRLRNVYVSDFRIVRFTIISIDCMFTQLVAAILFRDSLKQWNSVFVDKHRGLVSELTKRF